ncbi:hypothetical protein PHYBLDRAFT_168348 [Phycomyces blakesleeanus NRRL 1555(-)]|uniref:Uncharacterized protein n=1 Tax=Phycomyces blakesleeanus (strain ATCC 8743b / DSM 1359 / FGSC 10004 / NBRC 33097 / NRRL 1555) TaxID=763407 RepID=A0A167MTJ7_PHYB8|nr:hypothetical protein PHYBLDRAFT_168348 [Phycomyces blakesleeanus NRRL 1555(-)]OAD73924.1 hypothetical protein PHYBLDRAFT_168348 [Phycomyces blakesleeanus NRRL 1555(-)]|eukprot:XP_018291964.1 hypothetical protein PHYBLDRAFT_168348 [Phycomyces blakesleeanus NRRL 1555(-)]
MSHLPGVLFFWKDPERPIDMILLQSDQSKSFDFLDTRVLLPSDASPSQCLSGLAKAISPKLLSTIKHGYEHDEPPSHEHIANRELSFHMSVIDMTILASPMYSLGLQINPFASGRTTIYKQATHNWAFLWEILFGEYLFYQNIGHFKLYEG